MLTGESGNTPLSFIPIFPDSKKLDYTRAEISRRKARILGLDIRGIRANSKAKVGIIVERFIVLQLVPLFIIKPNHRHNRMNHIATVLAVHLLVQVI